MGFIRRVEHVQIGIPRGSEVAAREFYCEFLGMQEIAKPAELIGRGGFWASVGTVEIHFGVEDFAERSRSCAHVAYEVEDLSRLLLALEVRGISCIEGTKLKGRRRYEFRDPFGNRVEIFSFT